MFRIKQLLYRNLLRLNLDWISTKRNPADPVSRGLSSKYFVESSLWWNGPDHLRKYMLELNSIELFRLITDPPEARKSVLATFCAKSSKSELLEVFERF